MDTTIAAAKRTDLGKGSARKSRSAGKLPAIIYGPGSEPTSVEVDPKALNDIFRISRNRNTVVYLDVEGAKEPVLVREVQRHPLTRALLHVDFYRVSKERKVEVMVPVAPFGRPKGAILGGRLRVIRREIRTRCDFDNIPESFPVDIGPMDIGDMVKASEIPTPEGVEMVFDHDFNVLTVYGKKARAAKKSDE